MRVAGAKSGEETTTAGLYNLVDRIISVIVTKFINYVLLENAIDFKQEH